MRKLLITILILPFLLGCATAKIAKDNGVKSFNAGNINLIKRGETTQKEILEMFGEPMIKTSAGGLGSFWTYASSDSKNKKGPKAPGNILAACSFGLSIVFDDKGIVTDFSYLSLNP